MKNANLFQHAYSSFQQFLEFIQLLILKNAMAQKLNFYEVIFNISFDI
jgi:hypothetical protein